MKMTRLVLLMVLLALTACGQERDKKPLLDQQRQALDKAKQVDGVQQLETQKQKQGIEQQTQ